MAELEHSLPELPEEKIHGPSILGLDPDWTLIFLGWLIACISTLGSLFFSYVMEFAPCILCWYQRICLFPLVIILARGLFPLVGTVHLTVFELARSKGGNGRQIGRPA